MDTSETTQRPVRIIIYAALIFGACLNVIFGIRVLSLPSLPPSDFLAFWSYAQFASGHNLADIYNSAKLQVFQDSLFPGFTNAYPLLYPPIMLVVVSWMKYFSYPTADAIWTAAGLIAMTAAAYLFFKKDQRLFGIVLLLASPATLINGIDGNSGFFTAALLMTGFALLPSRPFLAGMVLGFMAVKPHLAILLPFALLGGGHWRAILGTGFMVIGLAALSCIMFPAFLWSDWLQAIAGFQSSYFTPSSAGGSPPGLQLFVTIMANLVMLGVPHGIALLAQTVTSIAVACATFFLWRRGPYELAVAGLYAGIFLASPHAYVYDTIPVLIALAIAAPIAKSSLSLTMLGLVLFMAPFMVLTAASHWFLYAVPEGLLYLVVLRLAFATPGRQISVA